MAEKRHHYVPKAYLKAFCNNSNKVRVHRKDDPENPIWLSPDNVCFHKYYYSQPLENGSRDNGLEKIFSQIESKWPSLSDRLRRGDDVNDSDSLECLFAFIGLQRVRVPAARDATEKVLADEALSMLRAMDAEGKLLPKPSTHPDILDKIEVAVDPHRSIIAMASQLEGLGVLYDEIGIGIIHNTTNIPFFTSDNPVVWFDPSVSDDEMRPYKWNSGHPVILLFPISPDCMVYGASYLRDQFISHGIVHGDIPDPNLVEMMNRQICRFAYHVVISQQDGYDDFINQYATVSPVAQPLCLPLANGRTKGYTMVFGQRKPKPKW